MGTVKVRQKRYEYWGREGKTWTEWFDYNGPEEKMQGKGLKNEYRYIDVDEEEIKRKEKEFNERIANNKKEKSNSKKKRNK